MTQNDAGQVESKPWYQSQTIWALLAMALTYILRRSGVQIAPDDPALTALLYDVGEFIGGIVALIGRWRATQPIALTKPDNSLLLGVFAAVLSIVLIRVVAVLLVAGLLTGCEGMRFAGGIQTDYGSISSDGKTVTTLIDTRGFGSGDRRLPSGFTK